MLRKMIGFGVLLSCVMLWSAVGYGQAPSQPGPEHAVFKKYVGNWKCEMTFPGGPPVTGTSTFALQFEGLHLAQDFQADLGGLKFQGKGVTSYCPVRKKYIGHWTDTMTASPMISSGTLSADGKVLTETGEGAGQNGLTKYKTVSEWKDDDTLEFKMYEIKDDAETEMMQITYRRQK